MHTKVLVRTENFHSRYQQWREQQLPLHLDMIRGSFANEVFGKGSDDLRFENNEQYARITWSPGELPHEVIGFLMDHLKDLLLQQKYSLKLSDERTEVYDNGIKITVHRHYLKPDLSYEETLDPKSNRLFGNVFLEHRFNSELSQFCITSNYYGNYSYLRFEKLMEVLLV